MKNNKIILGFVIIFLISLVFAIENVNSDEINSFSTENINDLSIGEKVDVIIVFKENINETMLENSGAEIKENLNSIDTSIITADKESIKEIQNNSNVETIEPDINLELFGDGSTVSLDSQIVPWGIDRVNAPKIWNEFTGKRIKIAVIDSGINKNHPDLNGNVVGGISFINNAEYWDDESGHGTSVAGVIGATNNGFGVVGVAPEAELYSVKVIGTSGGKLSNFIQGIQWAIDNDMDIVVMSLGIPIDSPSLNKMVDEAYSNGIILVAASGKDNQIYYPAKYSSVIAVGSINENNELTNENGAGEELELVAPGANIISTSNEGYNSFDGTSMAAPHVAGVIALLKENYPLLSNNEIRAKLQRDAIDFGESGKDNYFGYGLVNINLNEENLTTIIQIIFPEDINQTNFEKVEIIKILDGEEKIVHTLFYNSNIKTQNISIEEGTYKIKQYFANETYEESYNISEGDLIVVSLHSHPTHEILAYQAYLIFPYNKISEFSSYIGSPSNPSDTNGDSGTTITEGAYDEDSPISRACNHFWNTLLSPTNWDAGLDGWDPLCNSGPYDSAYRKAQTIWDDNVIPYYTGKDKYGNSHAINKGLSYWWLGRVTHILEDMSVPAHVHNDRHVLYNYENYVNNNCLSYTTCFGSASGTPTQSLSLSEIFLNMAEKADDYDSEDVDGEVDKGSRNTWYGTISDDNYQIMGNVLMPEARKNIAGLYRLFWAETHNLVPCSSGECCDTSLTLTKEYGQQPNGVSDYYYTSGANSPTQTSYVIFRNYYCTGSSATPTYSDNTVDTCGICKYANNGASSCSNYDTAIVYDTSQRCSLRTGDSQYNTHGEYLCQDFCNGAGNRGYAGNCTFSTECARQYYLEPISYVNLSNPNNILLETKSTVDVNLNKMAKDMSVSLDENISLFNCTQCQSFSSNLTNLSEGKHTVGVSLEDYVNNTISDTTEFYVDIKGPIIHEQLPLNGTKVSLTTINFEINYSEENVQSMAFVYKFNEDNFTTMDIVELNYPQGENQNYSIPINLSQIYNGTSGQLDFFLKIVDVANRETNSSVATLEIVDCISNWVLEENWSECDINDLEYKDWFDLNSCGDITTKPDRLNQTCDYCNYSLETISTEWQNDSCLITDIMKQKRTNITYDANYGTCYLVTNLQSDLWNNGLNITVQEYKDLEQDSCNNCSENISEPQFTQWSECLNGTKTRVKYYVDYNYDSCCAITNLDSDCSINNQVYQNITETSADGCNTSEFLSIISPIEGIYNERSVKFNVSSTSKFAKLVYTDNNGGESPLCTNCYGYAGSRTLGNGYHTLLFKGILPNGNNLTNQTSFFIDSKDPQISTTKPSSRRYTNGSDFYIKYTEDNLQNITLFYGADKIEKDNCEDGQNKNCTFDINLNKYDNQSISYSFRLVDVAGNIDEYRDIKIKVDTTVPEIKDFKTPVVGRYVHFNMTILNEDRYSFNKVEYIDNSELRPRWRSLCTSLKDNNCYKRVHLRVGTHNMIVRATDEAGNSDSENVVIDIKA